MKQYHTVSQGYISKSETIDQTIDELSNINNRLYKAFLKKDSNKITYLQDLYKEIENRLKSFCGETEDEHHSGIQQGKKGEWFFNPDY